jgi:hypothetical protein
MLTIVWDVDDVLNDLMRAWFEQGWKQEHPECRVEYADLRENPPHRVLGVRREEYLASIDSFRRTEAGTHLTPDPQLLRWFGEHGAKFRHIALTARPLETAPEVASWVMRHFGAWIRCFGIVPTRELQGVPVYDQGKGDYLRWLGKGDLLIDDARENLRQAEDVGLKAVAWPQPWNDAWQGSQIESNWQADRILEQLLEMARKS